jgi:anthraniloyl-CoA monooxygenase
MRATIEYVSGVKIACIGGGPAGLYLGILVKRSAPEHDVVVYERNRPDDTFGFGVVFSDATLGHLAAADPETHAQIAARFARWDDIEIHVGGESLRSTGHGFCGIERKQLLQILQARASELGVRVAFERDVRIADARDGATEGAIDRVNALVGRPDVVVACDGVASAVRELLAGEFAPAIDVRPNRFVWLGTTVPYRAFTFVFKPTAHGLYRVHAYRYAETGSTFIVECTNDTWRAAGFDRADEDRTIAMLGDVFARELAGHRLIKNRSIWRNFPTVRCARWHAGNVVLVGDAAHTAHFSIGSGTKLAMEDAIALRDELLGARGGDVPAALAAYEARRRPEVEALQAAAQASLEWFEGTERYMDMPPVQLTYSLMTRSLRVSHASVLRRDPHLAHGAVQLVAASVGVLDDPPAPPSALPLQLGDRRLRSRVAVAPEVRATDREVRATDREVRATDREVRATDREVRNADDEELVTLGAAASSGVGLVITGAIPLDGGGYPGIASDEQAVAWRRVVDYLHARGVAIAARVAIASAGAPGRGASAALAAGVERVAFAGFDLLVLDGALDATDLIPAAIASARAKWRAGGWIAAIVRDLPARAAVIGRAAQLVRAGADLLWVESRAADGARGASALSAFALADRLRNELDVATALAAADAQLPDLDAAIAAGRADLVVIDRPPANRHGTAAA